MEKSVPETGTAIKSAFKHYSKENLPPRQRKYRTVWNLHDHRYKNGITYVILGMHATFFHQKVIHGKTKLNLRSPYCAHVCPEKNALTDCAM